MSSPFNHDFGPVSCPFQRLISSPLAVRFLTSRMCKCRYFVLWCELRFTDREVQRILHQIRSYSVFFYMVYGVPEATLYNLCPLLDDISNLICRFEEDWEENGVQYAHLSQLLRDINKSVQEVEGFLGVLTTRRRRYPYDISSRISHLSARLLSMYILAKSKAKNKSELQKGRTNLSKQESWSLFSDLAVFDDKAEKEYPVLHQIGRSIVDKCAGCPLAIITLGSRLRSIRDEVKWKLINESKLWDSRNNAADVALRISTEAMSYEIVNRFVSSELRYVLWEEDDQIVSDEEFRLDELKKARTFLSRNYLGRFDCMGGRFPESTSDYMTSWETSTLRKKLIRSFPDFDSLPTEIGAFEALFLTPSQTFISSVALATDLSTTPIPYKKEVWNRKRLPTPNRRCREWYLRWHLQLLKKMQNSRWKLIGNQAIYFSRAVSRKNEYTNVDLIQALFFSSSTASTASEQIPGAAEIVELGLIELEPAKTGTSNFNEKPADDLPKEMANFRVHVVTAWRRFSLTRWFRRSQVAVSECSMEVQQLSSLISFWTKMTDKQVEVGAEIDKTGSGKNVQRTLEQNEQYFKRIERLLDILRLFPRNYGFDKQQLGLLQFIEHEPVEISMDTLLKRLISKHYILTSSLLYKLNKKKVNFDSELKPGYLILNRKSKHEAAAADILHLSVQDDDMVDSVLMAVKNSRGLRTLLFNGNRSCRLEKMLFDIFMDSESLVVLDLSGTGIKQLPSSFGNLTRLLYLDLSWTLLELLPESICDFVHLETLRLKGCSNIWRLPREFKRLTKLKHLEFDVFGHLSAMPEGTGSLVNIQTISAFLVGTQKGCKIVELENLNSITGEFCIAMLENVQHAEEAEGARIHDKKHVTTLELRWTNSPLEKTQVDISNSVLESLRPHKDLEELQIHFYGGSELPRWIGDGTLFHKLSSITLFKCDHVLVLPSLQKLPSLEYLKLYCLVSVTELDFCCENGGIAFPKLHTVVIEMLLLLKQWKVTSKDDFPCLVGLTIKGCPVLSELPELVYGSSTLKSLMVENCALIKNSSLEEGALFYDKLNHIEDVCIFQEEEEEEEEEDEVNGFELV